MKNTNKVVLLCASALLCACEDIVATMPAPECPDKCPNNEVCYRGQCVDPCTTLKCDPGLVCKSGECVPDNPCDAISCAPGTSCIFTTTTECIEDSCIDNGAEKVCPDGQMCKGGECVDDGCVVEGVVKTCDVGWKCVKGDCTEIACIDVPCPAGTVCSNGKCLDPECVSLVCDTNKTCVKGDCIFNNCIDKTECPQGKLCIEDGSCQFDSAPSLVVAPVDDTVTDENGKTSIITVTLNHEPASDVHVQCILEPEDASDEVQIDCSNITFTSDDWSHPHDIILTGLPDHVVDGDQNYTVKLVTVSDDDEFDGLDVSPLPFTNKDVDTATVIINAPDTLVTTEGGGAVEFTAALSSKPNADVTVTVTSDNTAEGTVSTSVLTFTPDNWNTPQTVTITGVNDETADGAQEYHIIFGTTQSEDPSFNGLEIAPLTFTNVDDDTPGVLVTPAAITTDEHGKTATVSVMLNTEPKDDITLHVTSSNTAEAIPEKSEYTISKTAWHTGTEIVVTGVADNIIDDDQHYVISIEFSSSDTDYNGKTETVNGTNLDIDKADFATVLSGTSEVHEDGTDSVTVNISLTSRPTADVTVTIASSDPSEITPSKTTITFTPDDWNKPQPVIVTGVKDYIVDGNQKSNLVLTATSEDTNYNGVENKVVEITTIDDDKSTLVINSTQDTISENGGSTSFSFSLSSMPSAPVTVSFVSTNPTSLTPTITTVTIAPEDWNKPITVPVNAIDNKTADGNRTASIKITCTSDDPLYDGLEAQSSEYTITDDEQASVVIGTDSSILRPGAFSTTGNVKLSVQPTSDVTVTLTTSNAVTAQLSQTTFTFTPDNWNVAQTFTVTDSDPAAAPSAVSTENLSAKAASACTSYDGKDSNVVTLTLRAFDNLLVKPGSVCTTVTQTLLPGKYKLQAWGASGGDEVGYDQNSSSHAGLGGYAEGVLTLTEKTTVYIHAGKAGTAGASGKYGDSAVGGGCNGGGGGGIADNGARGFGGGGASDIRIANDDLYSRVIVAGGGGGADNGGGSLNGSDDGSGGYGGGSEGGKGKSNGSLSIAAGTQTSGFAFGKGKNCAFAYDIGGGGGGWFGGQSADATGNYGGGGGSGFVYTTENPVSGFKLDKKYFLSLTSLKAGNTAFPTSDGNTETGHKGDGLVQITLVD